MYESKVKALERIQLSCEQLETVQNKSVTAFKFERVKFAFAIRD